MSRIIPACLAGIAAVLGLVVVYQFASPVAPIEEETSASPPRVPELQLPAAYTAPPIAQFDAISSRPMFDPARQPSIEPTIVGSAAGALPPDLSLVGVIIGSAGGVALLKRDGERQAITARPGQSVGGWQLVRLERSFVVFRGAGGDFTLKLRTARGLPQPHLNNPSSPAVTGPSGR